MARDKADGVDGSFLPRYGGGYGVFDRQPMLEEIVRYCVQDVLYLPLLWAMYDAGLEEEYTMCAALEWRRRIEETRESQGRGYEPGGREKVKWLGGADRRDYSAVDRDGGRARVLYMMSHHRGYVM